jgi:hypothetical protein
LRRQVEAQAVEIRLLKEEKAASVAQANERQRMLDKIRSVVNTSNGWAA